MYAFHPRGRYAALLAAAALCTGSIEATAATDDDGRWHFHVVPYLWLPAVDGSSDLTLRNELGPVSLRANAAPKDYLSDLNMAVMVMGEARKGPWSLYTDVLYTSFGNQDTTVRDVAGPAGFLRTQIGRDASTELSATVWTLTAGYRVVDTPHVELDLMAGTRYLTMDSDVKLTLRTADGRFLGQTKVSLDQDNWDGIVGLRGQFLFPGSDWYIPYYADVGTGDSDLTWQAMLGVGYRFNWGEVTLAYRALGYDFSNNDADLTLYGPGLGVGFSW